MLAVALALFLTTPAHAQDSRRQTLLSLARTLGESHALRQACNGQEDQYWRARMERVIETESDPSTAPELKTAFNAGYAARQDAGCTPGSRAAAARVAARGRDLASSLAAMTPMAEPPAPR